MRFMEMIRKKGATCLGIFLAVFLVSVFAGLGVGAFSFQSCEMAQPVEQDRSHAKKLVTDQPALETAMLTVNGEPVEEQEFFEKVMRLMQNRQGDDPGLELQAYGAAARYSISEIVIAQQGVALDVKVTAEDMNELKDQVIAQFMNTDEGSTGNIIGDWSKKVGTNREKKAAFTKYLVSQGLTEERWNTQARLEKLQQKTQEAWQEAIDAEVALAAAETKAIFDQRLADGDDFADLALEFSEDPTVENTGAVEPMWISRGLVTKEQEEAAFACEAGEITDWIEVPAGWSRFKVLEYKKAEGPEFEAERESIVTSLQAGNPEFEPTDDQIARQYEQVNVIQVMLKTSAPGEVNKRIQELVDQADVQMNNPYLLAYQAMYEDKLQPPAGWGLADLQTIAELSTVGEGYDFGLIQKRLDRAAELTAGDEPPAETAVAADGDPAETTDEAAADEAPVVDPADEAPKPLYALAVGLFKLAIQDEKDPAGYFPYYIIGRTYLDWLADEDAQVLQPVDRDAAREDIETNLARAAERYDYSAMLHASRGLNLAWLGRNEEAFTSLDLAMKYTPAEFNHPVFEEIRKGYEVLDATDRLAELDAKIARLRQEQMQRMIEEQMQGETGNQGNVINIPAGSDLDEVLDGVENGTAADGEGAASEPPAGDGADTGGE